MKSLTFIFLFMFTTSALATKRFVIYTDQPDRSKANSVANTILNSVPFNEFDIEVTVEYLETSELGCEASVGNDRNLPCNGRRLNRRASRDNYDQAMVVRNLPEYGGSGGAVPVITVGSGVPGNANYVPDSMMLHEFLHTCGFADEYNYSESEANRFCTRNEMRNRVNFAYIEPRSQGYSSDADARNRHNDDIPWYGLIQNNTPITSGNALGTPPSFRNLYGLFRTTTCDASVSRRGKLWKPLQEQTLMDSLHVASDNMAPQIRQVLASQGFTRRTNAPTPLVAPAAITPLPRNVVITPVTTCSMTQSTEQAMPMNQTEVAPITQFVQFMGDVGMTQSYNLESKSPVFYKKLKFNTSNRMFQGEEGKLLQGQN